MNIKSVSYSLYMILRARQLNLKYSSSGSFLLSCSHLWDMAEAGFWESEAVLYLFNCIIFYSSSTIKCKILDFWISLTVINLVDIALVIIKLGILQVIIVVDIHVITIQVIHLLQVIFLISVIIEIWSNVHDWALLIPTTRKSVGQVIYLRLFIVILSIQRILFFVLFSLLNFKLEVCILVQGFYRLHSDFDFVNLFIFSFKHVN